MTDGRALICAKCGRPFGVRAGLVDDVTRCPFCGHEDIRGPPEELLGYDDEDYHKEVEEVEHVGDCPEVGCEAALVAMTPVEMRRHVVEDHGDLLGILYVWPTDAERERRDEERGSR